MSVEVVVFFYRKMKKPLIAVIPLYDDLRQSIWMLPGYLEGLTKAGAVPIILPLKAEHDDFLRLVDMCQGLLLTGGHDVDPALYAEKPTPQCGHPCPERDALEQLVFQHVMQQDKPVLGICRGIQLINVLCGGTLFQDLPSQHASEVCHQMTPPYDRGVHEVHIVRGTSLHQLLGKETLSVNSYHHQAIKHLAPTLTATAYSADGLVEAVEMTDKRYVKAVQWHPELSFKVDEDQLKILEDFVSACK